jgi:general secretion pathway protein I
MRRCWRHRAGGFSLIEMLVALAIFGLAVLGLLNLAGESTRTAVAIEERVLAGVVADNLAVEAMTAGADGIADARGGSEVAGDLVWRWTRTLSPTDNPEILRVDITVRPELEERISAELSLFLGAPR